VGDAVADGSGKLVIDARAVRSTGGAGTIGVLLPRSSVYRYQTTSQTVAIRLKSVISAT
jgi:hypothetical protein